MGYADAFVESKQDGYLSGSTEKETAKQAHVRHGSRRRCQTGETSSSTGRARPLCVFLELESSRDFDKDITVGVVREW